VVEEMEQEFARRGIPVLKISAVTTAGTKEMMRKILTLLAELPDQMEEPVATNLAVPEPKYL
jgi:Fe2+ transport system protein B